MVPAGLGRVSAIAASLSRTVALAMTCTGGISTTGAFIHGSVNSNSQASIAHFEYGTSLSLNRSASLTLSLADGEAPRKV